MLYFNKDRELYEKLFDDINRDNIEQVREVLCNNNIEFASIIQFEDESIEIIHDNDYILLGPCGGVYKTCGKYDKYNGFDIDLDEFDTVLKTDIQYIMSGNIPVINLG